jgi:hypothetical protein
MGDDRGAAVGEGVAALAEAERAEIGRRKATCPFLGPLVASGQLPVRNDARRPLAGIADLVALGNTGGGDLGDLLGFFAQGNHGLMEGSPGVLDRAVPAGLFSLDLPGSQGSHPGHSGMLQGDPGQPDSGRFDEATFQRFIAPAREGLLKRSDVGRFIADNLRRDPAAKVFGLRVAGLLAVDLAGFVGQMGPAALEAIAGAADPGEAQEARRLYAHLTRLMGEDNLIGSAGEFGLLFAFLENRPGARALDGEPALPVADLTSMFREMTLPSGWESWPKRRVAWVVNTTALMIAAGQAYLFGERTPDG